MEQRELSLEELEIEFFKECEQNFSLKDFEMIKKAYAVASLAHQGVFRESGAAYITHPLAVSLILLQELKFYHCDTICAALLHDTVEDTSLTLLDIEKKFNKEVAFLVEGVTKVNDLKLDSKEEKDQYNNALMLRKMIENPLIILIKLADRMHNMRTLAYKFDPNKRYKKALETSSLFIPLADHIGLRKMKEELEDLCFCYLAPKEYQHTYDNTNYYKTHLQIKLTSFLKSLSSFLEKENLKGEISVKFLNIYKIFEKLMQVHKFSKMKDFITIRISFKTKRECMLFVQKLREKYSLLDFQDEMSKENLNGYQALCFHIMDPNFRDVSFEVSTTKMARINDLGYVGMIDETGQKGIKKQIDQTAFMKMLREISLKYHQDLDYFRVVQRDLLVRYIQVYTPKGKLIWLKEGSNVLDFARKIHSDFVENALYGIVNQKEVPLDFILKEKDVVEIVSRKKKKALLLDKRI